jgi:hypothetical protein
MAAIYSNGGNHWNILGFNFTKRDALSSVYKISMSITFNVADRNDPITDAYTRHVLEKAKVIARERDDREGKGTGKTDSALYGGAIQLSDWSNRKQ